MLVARSAAECRLYMDFHPCHCGRARFDVDHVLRTSKDGAMLADYQGPCSGCDEARQFVFELDPALPPPPPAFGGNDPSRIICPGQFTIHAERLARSVPLETTGLSPDERDRAAAILDEAIAALTEVLKFIPANGDAVSSAAFVSDEGHAAFETEPGRFREDRIATTLDSLREIRASHRA